MAHLDVIRMGIIGCGGNGRGHLHHYLTHCSDVVQVVGLADPSKPAREEAWKMTGNDPAVKVFASHEALLKRTRPDAVLISTPHVYHTQQILDALAAGCHVLAEKPMVCSVQDAQAVIAAAKAADKVLAISYNRHTQGPYIYTRNAIQAGEIGEVVFVSCWQSQNWWAAQQGQWRQKMALSCGGQLNDSGSHLLDIVLWMTGLEPETEIMDGPLSEISGPQLALCRWGLFVKQFLYSGLFIQIFVPWIIYDIPWAWLRPLLSIVYVFLLNLVAVGVVHAVNPRLRIDQAMRYAGGVLVVAVLGLAYAAMMP